MDDDVVYGVLLPPEHISLDRVENFGVWLQGEGLSFEDATQAAYDVAYHVELAELGIISHEELDDWLDDYYDFLEEEYDIDVDDYYAEKAG